MEKNVRVTEREYSKKMQDLNRGFEVGGRSKLWGLHSPVTVSRTVILHHGDQDERGRSYRSADRCVLDPA